MNANGNFSDANVEQFYSVRINRMMSPSDPGNLDRPCNTNSLFQFQVVHRIRFHSGVILSKIVKFKPSYSA